MVHTGAAPVGHGHRNRQMDFWKGVASVGVILVHVPFPGTVGKLLGSVGTSGVVLFFLISGYAIGVRSGDAARADVRKRLAKNGRITLLAFAVYLAFTCAEQWIGGGPGGWIRRFADPIVLIRLLLLGDFEIVGGDPLWFMTALLYAYLIFLVLLRFRALRVLRWLLPLLLLLRIGMETYTNSFGADWHLSGNALVGALPVMALGYVIAEERERVRRLSGSGLAVAAALSAAGMLLASVFPVGGLDVSQPFKIACAACVFLLALRRPDVSPCRLAERIGRQDSLHVYLWHYLVIRALRYAAPAVGPSGPAAEWLLPPAVILLSVLLAEGICLIKKRRLVLRGTAG